MAHVYPIHGTPDRPMKAAIRRCVGEDGLGWVVCYPVGNGRTFSSLVVVEATSFATAVGALDELCRLTRGGANVRDHFAYAEAWLAAHDPLTLAGGTIQ